MQTYLFPNILDLPFILFLFKEFEKNTLLTEMKSRPREHARKEGFKSISFDSSSLCHKTSNKLFLVIDILHLVHCFKICFNYVLLLPTESSVIWSNKPVSSLGEIALCGNLRRWYLVNGHSFMLPRWIRWKERLWNISGNISATAFIEQHKRNLSVQVLESSIINLSLRITAIASTVDFFNL